jgi:hypothetical protein
MNSRVSPMELKMALKDLLSLADDKLEDLFNKKASDPTRARRNAIKGIDRTHSQFTATEPQKGRKWFVHKNDVVKFTPPFPVAGQTSHFVPSASFPDYLTHLRGAVEAGELDDVLKDKQASAQTSRVGSRGSRAWSPERRAAFDASKQKH